MTPTRVMSTRRQKLFKSASGADGDRLAGRPDGRARLVQLRAADPARAAVLDWPNRRILVQETVALHGVQQDVVPPVHAGRFVTWQQAEANQRNHQAARADLIGHLVDSPLV